MVSNEFNFSPRSAFDEKIAQEARDEAEAKKLLIAEEQSIIGEHV